MDESNQMLNADELANLFDHTLLRSDARDFEFQRLCEESIEYGFMMVAINSVAVKLCKKYLEHSAVHVGAAISFPLGQTTIEAKMYETENAIFNGADEIDYVINIGRLKEGDQRYIADEMNKITTICRNNNVISKVIFENCLLSKNEIQEMCRIALEIQPDFIKTSTGFSISGANLKDVALMKSIVGDFPKIKAAGGIRDLETAIAFYKAGARRIGSSSGVNIMKEFHLIQDQL